MEQIAELDKAKMDIIPQKAAAALEEKKDKGHNIRRRLEEKDGHILKIMVVNDNNLTTYDKQN